MFKGPKGKANELAYTKIITSDKWYKSLNSVITDPKKTEVKLAETDEERKLTFFGSFRGGFLNGVQTIDLDDIELLGNSKVRGPFQTLLHEIKEAYEDQVKNSKPIASTQEEWFSQFKKSHDVVLSEEEKLSGYNNIYSDINTKDDGSSLAVFVGEKKGKKGELSYIITVIQRDKDKKITAVKNYNGAVKVDKGEIVDIKLGEEIKK